MRILAYHLYCAEALLDSIKLIYLCHLSVFMVANCKLKWPETMDVYTEFQMLLDSMYHLISSANGRREMDHMHLVSVGYSSLSPGTLALDT